MKIHLVDGTYELFRHFFAVPAAQDDKDREIGAVRGVLTSLMGLIEGGATHIGVATDHVIESFRNRLYVGYKTGDGIPEPLWSQFPLLEDALRDMGIRVWPMVEFEADDALAAAAAKSGADPNVEQVIICSPDKDLAQCVSGTRIVQLDRRRDILRDEAGVRAKWGIAPSSIPDYLAVVGDLADGYPGLPGWGARAAELMLSRFPHLEDIPKDPGEWGGGVRGAQRLAATLQSQWDDALLFRTLATLRLDVPVFEAVDELRWRGATPAFERLCQSMQALSLHARAQAAAR